MIGPGFAARIVEEIDAKSILTFVVVFALLAFGAGWVWGWLTSPPSNVLTIHKDQSRILEPEPFVFNPSVSFVWQPADGQYVPPAP